MSNQLVYISPSYPDFEQDRVFDPEGLQDSPAIRLRHHLAAQGKTIHTADFLLAHGEPFPNCDYYAFGTCLPLDLLQACPQIRPRAFVIIEPPVVAPFLYQALPVITKVFERVYVYNIDGDGYSLEGADESKLLPFCFSSSYNDVQEPYWSRKDRLRRYVMINGYKSPGSFDKEFYSLRVKALAALNGLSAVDLYGKGWESLNAGALVWWPYWRFRSTLQAVYRGPCEDKLDTLSHYDFALCFENMAMKGYITEKIFDCFYAGTIPIYMGAPDIETHIPADAFVDLRRYKTWEDLHQGLMQMPETTIQAMREAGRAFLCSDKGLAFYDGMLEIFSP